MFKRLFWAAVGFVLGVITVSKSQSYLRAKVPKRAGDFLLGEEQAHGAIRTLGALVGEFNTARREREAQINSEYSQGR